MAITKPTVGATGWNTAVDALIDQHNLRRNDPGPLEGMPIVCYGHSYQATDGYNSGAGAAGSWVSRLASRKRMTVTNQATNGLLMIAAGDCSARRVFTTWTPNLRALITLCSTVNDVATYGTAADALRSYEHSVRAFLAFTRAKAKISAATAAWVYSSGWTFSNTSAITTTSRFQTTTPGSYAEVNIVGDAVDLLLTLRAAGNGTYTVTSGGVTVATVTAMNATMGVDYTPAAISLTGLGGGTHTIRITLTSGTWLGVDAALIPSETPPRVVVLGEGDCPSYAPSLLTTWLPVLSTVTAEFPHATYVPAEPGWDNTTMSGPDAIHPNDRGASYLTTTVLDALDTLAWSNGLNFIAASPTYSPPAAPATPAGGQTGAAAAGATAGGGTSDLPTVTTGTLAAYWRADTTSGVSNGAAIGGWSDSSGNSRALTATGGVTYQTAQLNGLPSVRLNGTNGYLERAGFAINQPFTVFVVARTLAATTGYKYVFVNATAGSPGMYLTPSSTLGVFAGGEVASGAVTTTAGHIYEAELNGAGSTVGVDGTLTSGDVGGQTYSGVTIGTANTHDSVWFDGDIFAVAVYTGDMSPADKTTVRQFLGTKYAITVV